MPSVAWRFALASLLLLGWCLLRGISLRFTARDHARLALLGWSEAPLAGMLLVLGGTVLVLRAKERVTSPVGRVPGVLLPGERPGPP